jgi:hypothetical protein
MFGFVTFVYPETVKEILAKGNPHYICESRVLVKPYKEKGKVAKYSIYLSVVVIFTVSLLAFMIYLSMKQQQDATVTGEGGVFTCFKPFRV